MADLIDIILRARDEASGPIDRVTSSLEGVRGGLSRVLEIAGGDILGNLATQGFDKLAGAVTDFGKGLITANASAEQMRQTLTALYGNAQESGQAFNWMTKFALSAPFTRSSIIQAGVAVASFGNDITRVIPALGNVAAVMGTDMPTAAQAFNDALAGRFQMMNRDLHISKESLVQFGLEMNKSGHVTNVASFVSAFEKLAQARFGDGMSLQMQTFNGQMSNLTDQIQNFQRLAGQGVFNALKAQLFDMVNFLSSHQGDVNAFAQTLSAGLARAAAAAIDLGQRAAPYVASALAFMARAFPLVERAASVAFTFVGSVVSTFGNWLQGTGFPAIQKVIAAIGQAWNTLYPPIQKVLQTITDDLGTFFGAITTQAGPLMQGLAGAFRIGLGAVQTIFGGALDLLSGNWAKFQNDVTNGGDLIATGFVQAFGGMAAAMVPLANNLFGPWTWLAINIRKVWDGIGGYIFTWLGALKDALDAFGTNFSGTLAIAWAAAFKPLKPLFDAMGNEWTSEINQMSDSVNSFAARLEKVMESAAINAGKSIVTRLGDALGALGNLFPGFGGIDVKKMEAGRTAYLNSVTPGADSLYGGAGGLKQHVASNFMGPLGPNQVRDLPGHVAYNFQGALAPGQVRDPYRAIGPVLPPPPPAPALTEGAKWAADMLSRWKSIAPGIDPNQMITGKRTIEQAQADINAKTLTILNGLGLTPGEAKGVTFSDKGGAGKDILKSITDLFKGLGGKFTMKDLLAAFGLQDLGKGTLGFSGGLPVAGFGLPGDPAGANVGGATGRAMAGVTQRVGLGQLGATFGQTLATTSLNGSDRTANAQDRMANRLEKLVEVNVQIRDALVRSGLPLPPPTSAARGMGVARPSRL